MVSLLRLRHPSIKFAPWGRLIRTHPAGNDFSHQVILSTDRRIGDPPKHRDLPDMPKSICDRPLKKLFDRDVQGLPRSEIILERLQRRKEPGRLLLPGERFGVGPGGLSLGGCQRPVQQIAEVRYNFERRSAGLRSSNISESFGCSAQGFGSPVGECGNRVAQYCIQTAPFLT